MHDSYVINTSWLRILSYITSPEVSAILLAVNGKYNEELGLPPAPILSGLSRLSAPSTASRFNARRDTDGSDFHRSELKDKVYFYLIFLVV